MIVFRDLSSLVKVFILLSLFLKNLILNYFKIYIWKLKIQVCFHYRDGLGFLFCFVFLSLYWILILVLSPGIFDVLVLNWILSIWTRTFKGSGVSREDYVLLWKRLNVREDCLNPLGFWNYSSLGFIRGEGWSIRNSIIVWG